MTTAPKILLVDDDARLLRVTARTLLARLGVDVVQALSVREAQGILEAGHEFEALLTDWSLDDGTGADVVRAWVEAGHDQKTALVWSGDAERAARRYGGRVWEKADPELVIVEVLRVVQREMEDGAQRETGAKTSR